MMQAHAGREMGCAPPAGGGEGCRHLLGSLYPSKGCARPCSPTSPARLKQALPEICRTLAFDVNSVICLHQTPGNSNPSKEPPGRELTPVTLPTRPSLGETEKPGYHH